MFDEIFRKPPGGESSNIFGEPEAKVRLATKSNPNFQSSIFSEEAAIEPAPKFKSSKLYSIGNV